MPSSWARETITRKRYPLIDDMGSQVVDYSATPETLDIEGCWPEPEESTIDDDGRTLTVTGYRIAAPYDADVLARDVIAYAGVDHKVTGDPQRVPSPTGRLRQSIIKVRRYVDGEITPN